MYTAGGHHPPAFFMLRPYSYPLLSNILRSIRCFHPPEDCLLLAPRSGDSIGNPVWKRSDTPGTRHTNKQHCGAVPIPNKEANTGFYSIRIGFTYIFYHKIS